MMPGMKDKDMAKKKAKMMAIKKAIKKGGK